MTYREYPKVMKHPHSRPAVLAKWDTKEADPNKQPMGAPAKFPDVIVTTKDQEMEYAAKGYAPGGVSDPEAYRREITGNAPAVGAFVEYPKYVYRMKDGLLEDRLVESAEQEETLGGGWHGSPSAAARGDEPEEQKKEAVNKAADPVEVKKKPRKKKSVATVE